MCVARARAPGPRTGRVNPEFVCVCVCRDKMHVRARCAAVRICVCGVARSGPRMRRPRWLSFTVPTACPSRLLLRRLMTANVVSMGQRSTGAVGEGPVVAFEGVTSDGGPPWALMSRPLAAMVGSEVL